MMNRFFQGKKSICIFVIFSVLSLSCFSAAAELASCTRHKYINVKIQTTEPRLEQFHGLEEGNHESFDLSDQYSPTYICGIMLNEKLDWMSKDALAAAWAAKGAIIMKHGTSIKEDLSRKGSGWRLCSYDECSTKPACNVNFLRCGPYGIKDEYGKSTSSKGAITVLEQKYAEMVSDGGSQTLAAGPTSGGKTMYRPVHDLLCHEYNDEGYWYECTGTCACVEDYSCSNTEEGVWDFCQYGCDPDTGKCKEDQPAEFCKNQEGLEAGDILDGTVAGCDMKVTVVTVYDVDVAATIEYADSSTSIRIDAGGEWEETVDQTTYTVEVKSLDGDKGTVTLYACCSIEPEEEEEPIIGPTPKPSPKPVDPTKPEDEEPIKPTPPESVCKPYYEVMSVKDEDSDAPEVKEPGECKYTETVEINPDNCEKTGGDLKGYRQVDVPMCEASSDAVEEMTRGFIGNPYNLDDERKRKLGVICDGGITDVTMQIKDDWIGGDEINIFVDAISGENASGYYDKDCQYKVCMYTNAGDEIDCGDWTEREELEEFQTEFSSEGLAQFSLSTLTGWDVSDLGGYFKIVLFSKGENQPEITLENETIRVCRDGFLTLCTSVKDGKEIYWGVEASEYANVATKREASKETTWLLNETLYMKMDAKSCISTDNAGTPHMVSYYTISNNPAYRKYVNETYGNETFYKKYASMPGLDPDYLYCYKTDLRNTSRCHDLNYNWYSLSAYNIDESGIDYREGIKEWNKYQDVDEISTLDMGKSKVTPKYEPHPCAISMDRDYYKEKDSITITYTNAGLECNLGLYTLDEDKKTKAVVEQVVDGSGTMTYALREDDAPGIYTVTLNCGECYASDKAEVNVSMMQNVMSQVFMVSPFLDDIRNSLTWTETGNDTLYGGAGFDRYDRCALSCTANETEFRLLPGCTNARGSDAEACSNCTDEGKCTVDSNGKCPGPKGDCWDQICRIRARNYALEADPGKKGDSFHGVPYEGKCPTGFPKNPIQIINYIRPAEDELWSSDPTAKDLGNSVPKCALDGGIIATSTFEFSPPPEPSPLVDMVFVIDTSGSMDDEWGSICGAIDGVVKKLKGQGIDLKYEIRGLGGAKSCSNGKFVPGTGEEDWGYGIIWAANDYAWRNGARRIIVPVSDEDLLYGDPYDSSSDEWITKAITAANTQKAFVYGIIGNGASTDVINEMTEISEATKGKATSFKTPEELADALIEIALKREYPAYAVSSNATIYMNQTAPNVWVLYQNESQNVTVNVSKKGSSDEENSEEDANKFEEMNLTIYPSLMLIETANMPFNVTYAGITRNGSRYNITRIYVPNETGVNYDYGKEFIVTSKLIINYTLLETAETLIVDLNNSYFTQMRRDIDYVACNQKICGSGEGYSLVYYGSDKTTSCGNVSTKGNGDIKTYRRETETELLEKEYSETDTFKVDAISHQDVLCSTLNQLKIEGTFDQYYDAQGNLMMYTASEDPLRITITPDILSGFTFIVNDSAIAYSALYYPAMHRLTRKESAPYSDWEWRNPEDRYGYQNKYFGFPEQCKKTCPALKCNCPAGDPLNATCTNYDTFKLEERTDCACAAQDCYPNPCVSNRTFHEEEGSVVANGDFETGNLSFWNITDEGSVAEVTLSGHSGYMLKLKGTVEQNVSNLSTNPYNQICIEYGLEEYAEDGKISLTVTVDGKDTVYNVWENSEECPDCLGWNKKCFPVNGYLSRVKVKSTIASWIDNINLGKYNDYVGMSTYATVRTGYMDITTKGWGSFGMLKTSAVVHEGNSYVFEVETLPRIYMDNRNFQIPADQATAILAELELAASKQTTSSASGDSLPALKKAFQENGVTLPDSVQIEKLNGNWRVTRGTRNYDLYQDTEGNIKVVGMGYEYLALADSDFKNAGYLVIKTFFKDIFIPLSPNKKPSRTGDNPTCYEVDLKFRRPSMLTVDVSPKSYTLAPGTRVTVTYKLMFYDGTPIPNEKVYVDLEGVDIWKLSPEGISRDYTFSIQEIGGSEEQQKKLQNRLIFLGYSEVAEKLEEAQYTQDGENKVAISGGVGAVIEVTNGICNMTLESGDVITLGITGSYDGNTLVYESREQMLLGYVMTDENGVGSCSLIPTGTSISGTSPGGTASSPSKASTGIHVVSIKSPLLSREFLLLIVIMVFGVFAYRYFGNDRLDLYSWWRDFRGKK